MKIIEVIADKGHEDTLNSIAEQYAVEDIWWGPDNPNGRKAARLLVGPDKRQAVLDALQAVLGHSETARIIVIPIDAVWPHSVSDEKSSTLAARKRSMALSREELYYEIEKGSRLNSDFLLLVLLSTIVATIGLIEDNVAVIIGAMVIAPLLGPNLALALATSLGDLRLTWRSIKTNLVGLGVALLIAFAIALLWPVNIESAELLARTDVGLDGAALALASGAAAVLSLTTGLPSVLVGVMVAVALLPPTAAIGLLLGIGQWDLAAGAGLLLAINVVCVNIAARIVFLVRGVRSRKWADVKKARLSSTLSLVMWVTSLTVLLLIIILRRYV